MYWFERADPDENDLLRTFFPLHIQKFSRNFWIYPKIIRCLRKIIIYHTVPYIHIKSNIWSEGICPVVQTTRWQCDIGSCGRYSWSQVQAKEERTFAVPSSSDYLMAWYCDGLKHGHSLGERDDWFQKWELCDWACPVRRASVRTYDDLLVTHPLVDLLPILCAPFYIYGSNWQTDYFT